LDENDKLDEKDGVGESRVFAIIVFGHNDPGVTPTSAQLDAMKEHAIELYDRPSNALMPCSKELQQAGYHCAATGLIPLAEGEQAQD
jgi:hypothetical protein